jgi:glucan phosphoethanolaminetransferase (alkaline phosphatase superfamily)
MKVNQIENEPSDKLFQGERALIITGLIGFLLSAGISIFIFFNDPIIAPEGNMRDAFSFNAAIGMFILSIAAILPLSRFGARKRKVVRWLFIFASIYSYTIETLQNFRGINPRFSREGTVVDIVAGMLFGVI